MARDEPQRRPPGGDESRDGGRDLPRTGVAVSPRARFDKHAFAVLRQAARQAMDEVPELAGVAVVCLWDFPDQAGLPQAALVLPEGTKASPDHVLRAAVATARFQQSLQASLAEAHAGLRELAENLARAAHGQTPQAEVAAGRDGAGGGHPAGEEGPRRPG